MLGCQTAHVACTFAGLREINHCCGKKLEDAPNYLKYGGGPNIDMVPGKLMCVDGVSDYPSLGCFAVRDMKQLWVSLKLGTRRQLEPTSTKSAQKAQRLNEYYL